MEIYNATTHEGIQKLFVDKKYSMILELENNNSNIVNIDFYIGRAYKELGNISRAINYLNRYISKIEGCNSDNNSKENIYLLSAYFHLGELYYFNKEYTTASNIFIKTFKMSNNSHIKAYEYIIELNPKYARENFNMFLKNLKNKNEEHELFTPIGHYYSPIPSLEEIRHRHDEIFCKDINKIQSINLNEDEQIRLFMKLKDFYSEQPFKENKQDNLRYFFNNNFYRHSDAIILYCMLRQFRPKRIIEIGSGFSSAVILDTNEIFLDNNIICSFIEPYPERLISILKEKDLEKYKLIKSKLQDIKDDYYSNLSEGDILFIDSSHVVKTGSDVNYIFNTILPNIPKGVIIHFHDIFYPFEYPCEWVYEGRAWNEAYFLKAFLQYNDSFEILFFNSFIAQFHRKMIYEHMPLCLNDTGGSIWIKKIK